MSLFPRILPWHMFILDVNLLITSPFVPDTITDTKDIIFAETTIPGLDHSPVSSGGFGNRKISFDLQIIQRKTLNGNSSILKLYDILRFPSSSLLDVFKQNSQFNQNPKVIYNYGIGSAPLIWYITKCKFTHLSRFTNAVGSPQFSNVSLELTLDEKAFTNRMEKVFREFSAIIGSVETVTQVSLDSASIKGF